ncbi:periplasmic heavy metal sensor [Defluviimonas sp. WL0002]|uniref:Periplasmic heavy metal sensor n=1 Tax=Albidovulum marisflavi TaxID=2984159 RepID=A0ABT2ZCP8_9RHOB|nr:periplasmic heavy metal sensor [Defluviimonas sp. WL0002]MCV2868792.1 periplasmic heavy metal sensor [Defluviimonas sp. WL0002]
MTQAEKTPRAPGRTLKIALVLSLAVNLLLVGLIAGAAVRHRHGGGPGDDRAAFAPYVEALPRAQRGGLRSEMFHRMPDLRDLRRERAEDLAAFVSTLRAEPFDPSAAAAVFDRQMARAGRRLEAGRVLFLDRIAAMSADERREYADRLEQNLAGGRR